MTKVLLIDDEPGLRLVCRVNLEADGIEVVEAADGEEGLRLAREERPDVVLVDVLLPGLDGWGVAEEMLADEATRAIPVVFVTALVDPSAAAGEPDLLLKPFDPTELGRHVREAAAARRVLSRRRLDELRRRVGLG